jgi:hypothetical protein
VKLRADKAGFLNAGNIESREGRYCIVRIVLNSY